MGQSLRTDILDTAPVSCLDLKQENYPCGFHHSFLTFGETWKLDCSIWWIKFRKTYSPSSLLSEHKRRGKQEFSGGVDASSASLHTNHTDVYLIKTPKTLTFCSDSTPVWGSPRDFFFSLSSVIIPFPPCERKDQNNPAEIYGSPGAEPLCWSKWKTRAAVAEWDTARSRVSRPPGAWRIDTDTGHYMIRLYGDQLGSVMRDTEHVQFTEETVSWNLIWGWMTGCRWNNSTCSSVCGEQRMERLRSFLREINESRKIFSPVQTVFTTKYPTIQLRSPFLHSVSQMWQQYPHQDSRHPQMPFLLTASWIYWTYQHFHCAKVLACSL